VVQFSVVIPEPKTLSGFFNLEIAGVAAVVGVLISKRGQIKSNGSLVGI